MQWLYATPKSQIMHGSINMISFSEGKIGCLFCWAAVNLPWAHQSLLAAGVQSKKAHMWTQTHTHTHRLTSPPAVRAEKTFMPHVMFQSLCHESSFWTLHWTLPCFLTLSLRWELRWRAVPAVTTQRSEARPWPARIQTNGPHLKIQRRCVGRESNLSVSRAKATTRVPSFGKSKLYQFSVTTPFFSSAWRSLKHL